MELVVTLILFAILITGIMKKVNLNLLLLCETFLILIFLTITKGSVMADASTGNVIIDCFAYVGKYLSSNIGGVVFNMAIVSAYVEVMKKIGATETLATLLCRGVSKVKSRALVLTLVVIISTLLRTCITSGPAEVILLLATFYPVMLACGCSVPTACAAILIPNAICWGPADPIDLAASNLMGIEVNMAEWFVNTMLPVWAVIFVVAIVVFIITDKFVFGGNESEKVEGQSFDLEIRTPVIYAILPMLPLIIMLVFSPFLVKSIAIDINGAVVLSLVLAILLVLIVKRKEADVTGMVTHFCGSFCDSIKGLGMTVLFAMMFAACLNMVGGMNVLANAIMSMNASPVVLVLIVAVFGGLINIVVGSFLGALSIAQPIAATIAAAAGINPALMCFIVVIACGAGCICSPVNPMVLILSEKLNTMELIKCVAAPIWCGVLVASVVGVMFL